MDDSTDDEYVFTISHSILSEANAVDKSNLESIASVVNESDIVYAIQVYVNQMCQICMNHITSRENQQSSMY